MKNYRIIWFMIIVMLSVAIMFSAVFTPVVQARDMELKDRVDAGEPDNGTEPTQAAYDPAAYTEVWGVTPDMMVNCDPEGNLLVNTNPGSAATFHKLQTGACRRQAALEEQELAQVALAASQGGCGGAAGLGYKSCGYSGVGGEGNMLKIYGVTTDKRYVYLQCGKKVGVIEPPSCSCSPSSYVYTYSCKRPPTVYITIPCH